MSPSAVRRATVPLLALAVTLIVPVPGSAGHAAGPPPAAQPASVAAITDGMARQLAGALASPEARAEVSAAVMNGPADLATLQLGTGFATHLAAANRAVYAAKGLPLTSTSLLRVRLGHADMRDALSRGATPLVAATPTDDSVASVVGYTSTGGQVVLDAARTPQRPVLLVEVDVARALPMGVRLMSDMMAASGVSVPKAEVTATGGYWANMVRAVRLNDDKEPWIKGDAEIFSIIGGWGFDGKARADVVQMPYLNNDGTTYYPNQLIVHYGNYKYNLADVVMYEDDGDTNYLALAQAITTALLTLVDAGVFAPLVNAILAAMPTSWWTDDPDYVDSWYTLATTTSGRRYGASGNGWMDIAPYWVSEL